MNTKGISFQLCSLSKTVNLWDMDGGGKGWGESFNSEILVRVVFFFFFFYSHPRGSHNLSSGTEEKEKGEHYEYSKIYTSLLESAQSQQDLCWDSSTC